MCTVQSPQAHVNRGSMAASLRRGGGGAEKTSFGLLGGIESPSVNLQMEDAGLRTPLRWRWKATQE